MRGATRRNPEALLQGGVVMDLINRSAVIAKPHEPFLAWTKLDDEEGLADGVYAALRDEEPHIFLLPDYEMMDEREELLDEFWPYIFETMLEGWCTDPSTWPKDRTKEMFGQWFEVQMTSVIEDLVEDEEIEHC